MKIPTRINIYKNIRHGIFLDIRLAKEIYKIDVEIGTYINFFYPNKKVDCNFSPMPEPWR